jgi:hypothetical protein
MKILLALFAHLLATLAKLLGAGDAKAIVADNLLMKQQLLIVNRSRCPGPLNISVYITDNNILNLYPLLYPSTRNS